MGDQRVTDLPRHLRPVWRGAPLKDKHVLIHCYRGLGDTIQFIRYAPLVKALATHISIAAQPELVPLLQTMRAFERIVPLDITTLMHAVMTSI